MNGPYFNNDMRRPDDNNNQLGNSTELPPFNPNFGTDTNAPDGIQQFMNNEQRERGNNHFG